MQKVRPGTFRMTTITCLQGELARQVIGHARDIPRERIGRNR